jgi:predicted nuclease of restriction endonuclease-like (RecB) superfamily
MNKETATINQSSSVTADVTELCVEITQLIDLAKNNIIRQANSELTLVYWHIGSKIKKKIVEKLEVEQNTYGEKIVDSLSRELSNRHPKGFSSTNLFHCLRFYETYPDQEKVYSLSRVLYWTHFRTLIYIADSLERSFYEELCAHENWSTRILKKKLSGMLYQRTALSKKPENVIEKELKQLREEGEMSKDLAFRDPYLLNFLDLPDEFSERDLENSILTELVSFLQKFGSDFCFVARQKRISIGAQDHYLDLLFFHRTLRRLIAIELKLGAFQANHKGQMELYLKWLEKYEKRPGEETPLGIILCVHKNQEEIELLELEDSQIHVAEYLLHLPPKEILEEKLHTAIARAKNKIKRLE